MSAQFYTTSHKFKYFQIFHVNYCLIRSPVICHLNVSSCFRYIKDPSEARAEQITQDRPMAPAEPQTDTVKIHMIEKYRLRDASRERHSSVMGIN